MQTPTDTEHTLNPGQCFALPLIGTALELTCEQGTLWLTAAGGLGGDLLLQAPATARLSRLRQLVLEPLRGSARFRLTPLPSPQCWGRESRIAYVSYLTSSRCN